MSRPTYETRRDRLRETGVLDAVCAKWNCTWEKLPMHYYLDAALIREGSVMAVAEVKCRKLAFANVHSEYLISAHKYRELVLWESTGKEALLIVKFTDCIAYHKALAFCPPMSWGGRRDRNDPQDMEMMVKIPKDSFKIV